MKKLRKGATLLITTITLSIVVATSAIFSGVYFRYGKMNNEYVTLDKEKEELKNDVNIAYEHFLTDADATISGEQKKLRSGWLNDLEYQYTLSVTISNFIANFRRENNPSEESKDKFCLFISSSNYTIQTKIEEVEEDSYTLSFNYFDRKAS